MAISAAALRVIPRAERFIRATQCVHFAATTDLSPARPWLAHVDFKAIARRTDYLETRATRRLANLMARAVWRIVGDASYMASLLDEDLADVGRLKLETRDLNSLRGACVDALKEAWALGRRQARAETKRAGRKATFADLRDTAADYFEANGFRMAQNLSDGARAVIQQELTRAVRTGERGESVTPRIIERLISRGFTDYEGVDSEVEDEAILADLIDIDPEQLPHYVNTLVRTNTFEAMNEARFAEFTDPALDGYVVALEYSAILDENTTEFCRYMDGRVYKSGSEVWDTHRPPNHYNCRSVLIPITQTSGWDGQESDPPTVDPADGFVACGHIHRFVWDESLHPRDKDGQFAPTEGGESGEAHSERQLSDEAINTRITVARLRSIALLASDFDKLDISGMSVPDRLALLASAGRRGNGPYIDPRLYALPYNDPNYGGRALVSSQGDDDEVLRQALESGHVSLEPRAGWRDASTQFIVDNERALTGLSGDQKREFSAGMVDVLKTSDPDTFSAFVAHDFAKADWSVTEIEYFADALDAAGARPISYWNRPEGSKPSALDRQATQIYAYTNNYELAKAAILDHWSVAGSTLEAQRIRDAAAVGIDANRGRDFYQMSLSAHAEDVFGPTGRMTEYSPRLAEHVARLYDETQAFYREKFRGKDPASKTVTLYRGVSGLVDAYAPGAIESWTPLKGNAKTFGARNAMRDEGYSLVSTKVPYSALLFTYESVAGQRGWPPEEALKGKREHVLIGGFVGSVNAEHFSG